MSSFAIDFALFFVLLLVLIEARVFPIEPLIVRLFANSESEDA
jgi:hypothetical protein